MEFFHKGTNEHKLILDEESLHDVILYHTILSPNNLCDLMTVNLYLGNAEFLVNEGKNMTGFFNKTSKDPYVAI